VVLSLNLIVSHFYSSIYILISSYIPPNGQPHVAAVPFTLPTAMAQAQPTPSRTAIAAFHAEVGIGDLRAFVLHFEYALGTDFHAAAAAGAIFHIQFQGRHIGQVSMSIHSMLLY
jgi:hypothetical protein